jgi:hypothetical protein
VIGGEGHETVAAAHGVADWLLLPIDRRQRICLPEMVRAMTSRWISEVPSKMV